MRRSIAQAASVLAVAIVAALSTTAALADNGNGNGGNSANAPGQVKQEGQPAQPQAAQPQAAQPVAQSDTAPGIKPSNSTDKWTKCSTGGGTGTTATCTSSNPKTTKADASKRYGNGKTAAQIANSRGAPAGTVISGPGNSQPHKVAVCPGKTNKSGGKDVHAVKSYSTASCSSQPQQTTSLTAQTSATQSSSAQVSSSSTAQQSSTSSSESTAVSASAVASTPVSAEAGVLGAVTALSSPSPVQAQGGVLGTLAKISGGTLPFSGFPLWEAMLAALALLAVGVALRRRSAVTR